MTSTTKFIGTEYEHEYDYAPKGCQLCALAMSEDAVLKWSTHGIRFYITMNFSLFRVDNQDIVELGTFKTVRPGTVLQYFFVKESFYEMVTQKTTKGYTENSDVVPNGAGKVKN